MGDAAVTPNKSPGRDLNYFGTFLPACKNQQIFKERPDTVIAIYSRSFVLFLPTGFREGQWLSLALFRGTRLDLEAVIRRGGGRVFSQHRVSSDWAASTPCGMWKKKGNVSRVYLQVIVFLDVIHHHAHKSHHKAMPSL